MKPKYKINQRLSVAHKASALDMQLEITQIGHFGSEQHYGFIGFFQEPPHKGVVGWIPVAMLDAMEVEVLP